ncbi:MAG: hypothetical protein LBM98_01525 [Oscillospiraceae bacterium]|nr:hypothetical protein [Oscillospiraceae bacterium]
MRYVALKPARQSSAGSVTYGMYRRRLRQPWIASPHIINYVSQVRWRLRKDGAPWAHHGRGVGRGARRGGFQTRPFVEFSMF